MFRHVITRRGVLGGLAGGLAGLGVTACSSSPTLDILASALTGIGDIGKAPGYALSDAQIEALPYASLGIRIGGGAPAITILASIDGDELHWASADRVVFVTRRGRLVKTVGLPRDLSATVWVAADPLASYPLLVPASSSDRKISRFVDIRPNDDFGVPMESRFEVSGDETISLLGRSHDCVRLREHILVRKWRWSTENVFWIDKDSGRVWKSRQQFCPDVPAMTLEVLKPAPEPVKTA